jgi:hypothetical protein
MKRSIKVFGIIAVVAAMLFTSCKKDEEQVKDSTSDYFISLRGLEPEVNIKGGGDKEDYTKVIVAEFVKEKECKYEIVSGIVEFYYQDELVFGVDFGNGQCDGIATVKWVDKDGTTGTKIVDVWSIFKKEDKDEYKEVITEELVKNAECDNEIVSGLIEYYDLKDNWIASVDFGNGECDGVATKCWINKDTQEQECRDFNSLDWDK